MKTKTFYRIYFDGVERFAHRELISVIRNVHYLFQIYADNKETFTVELRKVVYSPDGAVVSNLLITDKPTDLL